MIDRTHAWPITRQAEALSVSRGAVYYVPRPRGGETKVANPLSVSLRPRTLALVACLSTLVMPPAAAQVRGKVFADNGQPLAGVQVELWRGLELRRASTTGLEGAFALVDTGPASAMRRSVTFRRIGFRPFTASIETDTTPLIVTLTALPQTLLAVRVRAMAAPIDPCARKPSAEGALLFARAAEYYRRDTPWLDKFAEFGSLRSLGHADERGTITGLMEKGSYHQRFGNRGNPFGPRPFPVPEARLDAAHRRLGWLYPRFEWTDAPEFVLSAFVDSMPRAVVSKNPDGFVLSFCPRDRRVPYTSGEIELATDTTIVAIRWQFVVAKPRDDAGGMALFAAPESMRTKAHLLPMSAASWTRVPKTDTYEVTEYAYSPWLVARSDSISLRQYADSIHRGRRP